MNEDADQLNQKLQNTLKPRHDLTRGILQQINREEALSQHDDTVEETLEELLRAWPVSPRKTLVQDTLELTRAAPAGQSSNWKSLTQTVGLLAACLVITLVLPKNIERPLPAPDFNSALTAAEPIDEEIATLLALAGDLPQTTRWLIDEAPLVTLASAQP